MAILYKTARDTPVLLAANREERLARPSLSPRIQSGSPRVICGVDREAGGTWFGVNQYGTVATVTNRRKTLVPAAPRSRGLLCRELLNFRRAKDAAQYAADQLATGAYAGANYVCLDASYGAVVYGGDQIEIIELQPGLHTLSNGNLNDPNDPRQDFIRRSLTLHKLDSSVMFLAVTSRTFSRKHDIAGGRGIVLTGSEYGTASSCLLSLPRRLQQAILQHAPGPPSECPYEDLSALLRQVLSTERSRQRAKEQREKAAKEGAEGNADGKGGAPAAQKDPSRTAKAGTRESGSAETAKGAMKADSYKKTKPPTSTAKSTRKPSDEPKKKIGRA
ncbi:MAG: NRDE family protein, partial [Thermoguttaceae bacterium]|nr:NRDE family protein [Thermoguttaceae bacterium]